MTVDGKNPRRKDNAEMTMTDQTHAVAAAAVQAMADAAKAEALTIPATIVANARELDDLRTAKKVLEEREGVLRAALLDFLDAAGQDAVAEGGVAISRSNSVRKGIDRAKMEALYPKVLADVSTSTAVTQVRVKIKG